MRTLTCPTYIAAPASTGRTWRLLRVEAPRHLDRADRLTYAQRVCFTEHGREMPGAYGSGVVAAREAAKRERADERRADRAAAPRV